MSTRHPARLAVFAEGQTYYPRELTEVDGKLYIINEDGTSRILNDYKITTIQDGDGVTINTVDPKTQKTIRMPNASETTRGMVKLGTADPKAATDTASKGSSTAVSREDHTHPKQTDISGNAETATKFKDTQKVELTGDVTGSATSTGGWSLETTLKSSGVTAGSYGPTADATPKHGEEFVIPQITVDAKGRVTSATTRKITLPTDADTKYTHPTSPAAGQYGPDANAEPDYGETFEVPEVTVNALGHVMDASTKTVKLPAAYKHPTNGANKSVGPTADATPAHGEEFVVPQVTIDSLGHVTSANARTIKLPEGYIHPNDGTAGSYGPTADTTPEHGGEFIVPQLTTNGLGHVTKVTERKITLPAGYKHYSGTSAGTYGPSENATPDYGETFQVPQVTVNNEGHVTEVAVKTVKIPAKPNTELPDVGAAGSYGPTVNVEDYTFSVPSIEVDAKGRVTEASNKTITIPSKSKEVFEATLNPASAYQAGTDSPFVYKLNVPGILSTHNPIVDLVLSEDYSVAQEELSEFGKVYNIETFDGYVLIEATDALNTTLALTLKFVCIISPKSIENFTIPVSASDWTGSEAPYSKTIAVTGVLESDTPIVDLILPDDYGTAQDQLVEFNKVYKINVTNNALTLYATEIPATSVTMKLMCIR